MLKFNTHITKGINMAANYTSGFCTNERNTNNTIDEYLKKEAEKHVSVNEKRLTDALRWENMESKRLRLWCIVTTVIAIGEGIVLCGIYLRS